MRWKLLTLTVTYIIYGINSFQLCIGVVLVLQIFISNKIEPFNTRQDKFLDDYKKHSIIIWFPSRWTVATTFPRLKSTGPFLIEILEWQSVNTPKQNTVEDHKLAIHHGIWKITPNIYRNVINNFTKRREHVIEQKRRHVQHVL
jgi:hypothetical protein